MSQWKAEIVHDPSIPKPDGSLRLLCLSDTHGKHAGIPRASIPTVDLILFGGDFSLVGNPVDVASFKEWIRSFNVPAVIIAGNCDLAFDTERLAHFTPRIEGYCHPTVPIDTIKPSFLENPGKISYLEDSEVTVNGVRIYGSPYSPEFNDWGFPIHQGEAESRWSKIPDGIDVLLVHGPPKDVCDATSTGFHAGCASLRTAIERTKPALAVFGHIHEAHGIGEVGETLCANVAVLNVKFELGYPVTLIDLIRK
jgi:Icc-related predicted phosphoesterase